LSEVVEGAGQLGVLAAATHNRYATEALRTPLCRLLGVEWPVLSVGFGAGAGAELE
jgi:hypothetical protein